MTPLRIGVLGCADIALRRVLPAAAGLPGVEFTAVASRDPAKAEEAARRFGLRPVTGYAALLERADIDAVYVPLPAALHAPWVRAALAAGRHVLAEKPLTTERALTHELLAAARAAGLVLMENVMFVHHPQHTAVRRLVEDGAIGQLRSFQAEFAIPRPPATDIRHDPALGGGALWDVGVYPVRAALHHLGPALDVVGCHLAVGPGDRVDTAGAALLRTPDGVTAQLSFGLDHGYRSRYQLCGSEGRLVVDRAFTPGAEHRPVLRLERRDAVEEIELPAHDQVAATLDAFAAAVREGRDMGGESAHQADLLAALRASARDRAPRA
ncbi:Gfo/Idh/MocA family oxidoreductase [Streptomyces xanthochromogenes]|uniref:Gfo/Idh/MocA family protein n=1 Tax=Streptomyces xanthochromogenes TaxID=67384 RepID=UPI00342FCBFE